MNIWHRFGDGVPVYLARHYWWAYLWRPGAWFFDHQSVINAILFGQYKRLLERTLKCLSGLRPGRLLQLTCVYGQLSPKVIHAAEGRPLFLCDVASVQLDLVRRKLNDTARGAMCLARMNAEQLAFKDNSFSAILVFFLLHELPCDARSRVLDEITRVIGPDGRVIIVEYAPLPTHHLLYRVHPLRWLLTRLEPFLADFWMTDLPALMRAKARSRGKSIELSGVDYLFDRFYRVEVYKTG